MKNEEKSIEKKIKSNGSILILFIVRPIINCYYATNLRLKNFIFILLF